MKLSYSLFSIFALLLFFSACQKVEDIADAEVISGDAEFAIPLASATTKVEDLIENFDDITFIEIDPDGVIRLRYIGDVLTQTADEFLLDVRDSVPPFLPILDTVFQLPFSSPNQLEVDKAIYSSGIVSLGVKSSHVGPVDLTVRLPQATKDGQVMTLNFPFTGPTESLFFDIIFSKNEADIFEDLTDYVLEPVDGTIFLEYDAFDVDGNEILMDTLILVNENINFGYLEGFLGQSTHRGTQDTIEIEFFENWTGGDVYFEEPEIFIHIENSFGMPARSSIDTFDILTVDEQRIPLESDFITSAGDNGIEFPYPESPGEVATETFVFDKENSNIDEVLGSRPIALNYKVDAIMNPDQNTDIRGFMSDSSYYNIQVEVDLPLYARASGFEVSDTFEVDFGDYNDVKKAELKIISDNGMPLDVDAQIYFLNAQKEAVDSLFQDPVRIVAAAAVDNDGNVTSPTSETFFVPIDENQFNRIRSATLLALQTAFSTSNNGEISVRAEAGQEINVRMGMKITQ